MPRKRGFIIYRKGMPVCAHSEIYVSGDCKTCDRERNDRYRKRRRLGIALVQAADARGLSGTEALAVLKYADYDVLQECQRRYFASSEFKSVAST